MYIYLYMYKTFNWYIYIYQLNVFSINMSHAILGEFSKRIILSESNDLRKHIKEINDVICTS